MESVPSSMKLHYVDTSLGQLHYAEMGTGRPILLLHQTPRSHDEFRELIPLLAKENRVIAMDMYGFGRSAKFPAPHTIESYAEGAVVLMSALGISKINLLGHHTGALVALEVAASHPNLIENLLISSMPYTDAIYREKHKDGDDVDDAEIKKDGSFDFGNLSTSFNGVINKGSSLKHYGDMVDLADVVNVGFVLKSTNELILFCNSIA